MWLTFKKKAQVFFFFLEHNFFLILLFICFEDLKPNELLKPPTKGLSRVYNSPLHLQIRGNLTIIRWTLCKKNCYPLDYIALTILSFLIYKVRKIVKIFTGKVRQYLSWWYIKVIEISQWTEKTELNSENKHF